MVRIPGEKHIAIKMNDEFIARLDKIAKEAKLSRNQLIKNILDVGFDELVKLKQVGVFQLGIYIRDLHESISNKHKKKIIDPISGERPIPIKLDEEFINKLDELAEKAGLSRHQLLKNIIRVGLEEAEILSKVGIIKLGVIFRDLPESFRAICEKGEAALTASLK